MGVNVLLISSVFLFALRGVVMLPAVFGTPNAYSSSAITAKSKKRLEALFL